MEGGELFDWIVSVGKMPEELARFLFFQMLLAVRCDNMELNPSCH